MLEKLAEKDSIVQFQRLCGLKWKEESNDVSKTCSPATNGRSCNGSVSTSASDEKMTLSRCKYKYNPWIHLLFHLCSSLGDEQVLIALLSFIFWNYDPNAIMRSYICLAISLYFGQGAKDVFKIPRPPCPPVIRVEKKYAEEYSMPSTHAMMGMVVPFSVIYFTYETFQYNLVLVLTAATVCCLLVGASRVYLGMHSFKDVLMGFIFEIMIIAITFPCMKNIDLAHWCQISPNTLSVVTIFPLMLLAIYPTSTPISYNTFSDTALVLGIVSGSMIALRYSAANEIFMAAFLVKIQTMSSLQVFGIYMLRFATGTTLLGITRVVMKWLITSSLLKLMPSSMIMKPLGYKRFIEIPHKFITYWMVAFNCVYLAPKIFKLGGI